MEIEVVLKYVINIFPSHNISLSPLASPSAHQLLEAAGALDKLNQRKKQFPEMQVRKDLNNNNSTAAVVCRKGTHTP